jgi:DNA excision repair protein ERCC-2
MPLDSGPASAIAGVFVAVEGSPYRIGVRQLCEFAAKQGDLDTRFTPAPTSLQGMDGHREVASRRGSTYQREVTLSDLQGDLLVRGRADGYDPQANRLEEVKTHRGDLDRMPANHRFLHWAQAKVYAHLICAQQSLGDTQVALVYFNVASREETVLVEAHDAQSLARSYQALCARFLQWSQQELAHRKRRDRLLAEMRFPHATFRNGQRTLAASVYKAGIRGLTLMAQAPTGIGKTLATLFPALKACSTAGIDKIFFLTAKTTGRQIALDAMRLINRDQPAGSIRVLELVARDTSCVYPGRECHGESCPLAKGFYDRLPEARQAALVEPQWDKATLSSIGTAYSVCPYYLGHELAQWADVIVADYNHYFSTNAMLHVLAVSREWRFTVLIDEAHNLVERCRSMYTAELGTSGLRELRRYAPALLRTDIGRIQRALGQWADGQTAEYAVHAEIPQNLTGSLQKFAAATQDLLAESAGGLDADLMRFYFDVLHFLEIADMPGPHTIVDVTNDIKGTTAKPGTTGSIVCLRNVIPGPHLQGRWKAAHSVALYSATLSPQRYVTEMLGLSESAIHLDVPSPFAGQLTVHIARHISTRYRDRRESLHNVVRLMAGQFERAPGNYLAFFSSFQYLQDAIQAFAAAHPAVATWAQERRMGESQRQDFLDAFVEDGKGIGFAVLGGAFGEGIDLPGSRLTGAFIATLGLAQVNPVNEEVKRRIDSSMGHGFEYTYLYPGLQKVAQAAGRVVRTSSDTGTVHLMDDRFAQKEIRALLPSWWAMGPSSMA